MSNTIQEHHRENVEKVVKTLVKVLRPEKPGTDLSDPKTLAGAKRIATRKNNDFKRMIETKLPLFAEEVSADFVPFTPEIVIERRIESQKDFKVWLKGFNDLQRKHIRQFRSEVQQLVTGAEEMRFMIRLVVKMRGGDRSCRWGRALDLIKRRRTKPLSNNADLVLAWLRQDNRPMTHFEIWERRGDGLTPSDILKALMELNNFAYVAMNDVVDLPEKYHDIPGWKGRTAWNFTASVEN